MTVLVYFPYAGVVVYYSPVARDERLATKKPLIMRVYIVYRGVIAFYFLTTIVYCNTTPSYCCVHGKLQQGSEGINLWSLLVVLHICILVFKEVNDIVAVGLSFNCESGTPPAYP